MKSIRSKLLIYFLMFLLVFQIIAISIYFSASQITNRYDESFKRFLLLNEISQQSDDLYDFSKGFVHEGDTNKLDTYHQLLGQLEKNKEALQNTEFDNRQIEAKNYINTLDTFIHETELTIGFVLLDDLEQYALHIEDARQASEYIKTATFELLDVELTAYQPIYDELQKRNQYFLIFIIFLFLTTSFLALFFAFRFSKGITQPIQSLSTAASEVASGQLDGDPVKIYSQDELALLGKTFNDMRLNLSRLVKEIKDQSELDQLLKDMELRHLQNQINPHFLFNTLNTLTKMAYLENASETSTLINATAQILRHSLGEINHAVPLADEVQVVESYFSIQSARFSDRIQFEEDIDSTLLEVKLPRLTLQPLVENAFIHGVEEMERDGRIGLIIYQEKNHAIIEVTDNGVGMSNVRIESLLMGKKEDEHVGHSTGIGLSNVIRRLQLYYQTQDIYEIKSELGQGTTIRLKLPIDVGVKK